MKEKRPALEEFHSKEERGRKKRRDWGGGGGRGEAINKDYVKGKESQRRPEVHPSARDATVHDRGRFSQAMNQLRGN